MWPWSAASAGFKKNRFPGDLGQLQAVVGIELVLVRLQLVHLGHDLVQGLLVHRCAGKEVFHSLVLGAELFVQGKKPFMVNVRGLPNFFLLFRSQAGHEVLVVSLSRTAAWKA